MFKKIKEWFSKEEPKKQITEEMRIQEEWYEKAKDMTLEELPDFIEHLNEDYHHDYGTICHAIAASSIATVWAINNSRKGGMTGFQANVIMWQFIIELNNYDEPMELIKYREMLYPQYSYKFNTNTISRNTWNWIQKKAKEKLKNEKEVHPDVKKHWESIVDGKVPFEYELRGKKNE